jgi:hypothetical protein
MEKIMLRFTRLFFAVSLLSALAFAAAPPRIPKGTLPLKGRTIPSWIKPGVATSENPLVYVTVLTGLTTGVTDIYEIAGGAATLVGELNVGGGGALAVDSQENVYVIAADYDDNLYQQNSQVFVYPRGSTESSFNFTASGFGAEAMTVGSDGTAYMTGSFYPNVNQYGGFKFAAGSTTGVALPSDPQQPSYATGLSLDAGGNLFAGWFGGPADPCEDGCVEKLSANGKKWSNSIPDLAANAMSAGPFELSNGSQVIWTGVEGRFNYVETLTEGHKQPSQLAQLPVSLFLNGPLSAALSSDGTEIWATETGLGSGPGSNVYEVDYPSGNVSLSVAVNDPQEFFLIIGTAVSPTYFPAQ